MSAIARQFFAVSPVIALPIVALLLFVTVFVLVSVRALRARRADIDALARLPLGDSEEAPAMTEGKRRDEIQGEILHEYDGIEEADNHLPTWWLATFFGAVLFAIAYWFIYEGYGERAEGKIGPNLTDGSWIHGVRPTEVFGVIRRGVAAKGMPQWDTVLGPQRTQSVMAYVLSVRDTNVPGGKEPQGTPTAPAAP